MLTPKRLLVYENAYIKRLRNGEYLEEIDAEYLVLKRLTEEDIELIHSRIFNKNNRK